MLDYAFVVITVNDKEVEIKVNDDSRIIEIKTRDVLDVKNKAIVENTAHKIVFKIRCINKKDAWWKGSTSHRVCIKQVGFCFFYPCVKKKQILVHALCVQM